MLDHGTELALVQLNKSGATKVPLGRTDISVCNKCYSAYLSWACQRAAGPRTGALHKCHKCILHHSMNTLVPVQLSKHAFQRAGPSRGPLMAHCHGYLLSCPGTRGSNERCTAHS